MVCAARAEEGKLIKELEENLMTKISVSMRQRIHTQTAFNQSKA